MNFMSNGSRRPVRWCVLLLALSASVAFAAETVVPAFDEGTQRNYNGKTQVRAGSDGNGAVLTVTATECTTSNVGTAWTILTDRIAVPSGSVAYAVEFEIACATDWMRVEMSKEWGSDVSWRDAGGEEVGNDPLCFRFREGGFAAFRIGGRIPSGAVAAVIRLGTDGPNVKYGEDVRIRNFRMRFFADGEPVPEDEHPDLAAPLVKSAFDAPTTDANVSVRYEFIDAGEIDWSSIRVRRAGTKEDIPFVREGRGIVLRPGAPWAKGVNTLSVTVRDVAGNETVSSKSFLIGERTKGEKVTVRDDGVTLIDGKPFFPIGIYGVKKQMFNAWSFDRAIADLKQAGFNFVHSYTCSRDPEFLGLAAKHGMRAWTGAYHVARGDNWLATTGRYDRATITWYIGDDTSMYMKPSELQDRDEAARMLDGARLTCQADVINSGAYDDRFAGYAAFTDVFLPEIYPILGDANDEKCVARTIRDMKRVRTDLAKCDDGKRHHAVWPILQIFHGGKCWHRYPTEDEVVATTFASLIHGGKGVTWFQYQGKLDKEEGYRYSGCFRSEKDWRMTTNLVSRIASLVPVLLERDPKQPAAPVVLEGPKDDPLGQPAVSALVKRHDGFTYVLAVNASPKPVRARLFAEVPDGEGSVKWENRRITASKGVFEDAFKGFGVHVYRFATSDCPVAAVWPLPPCPPPPVKEEWGFVKELATRSVRTPRERFTLVDRFGCGEALASALRDLGDFLGGTRELVLVRAAVSGRESYRVDVEPARVTLTAEDDEGLRRAIYHLEDRVQAGDLKPVVRKPWLRHRFSRCFFAPTKRPPLYTDELTDDVDYYPDAYLNRLAHEGVNALWITVMLRDLAETSFTQRAPDGERRLAKLARTAEKLARYGIGLWIFAIEPRRVSADDPFRRAHPELFHRLSPDAKTWVMCPSEPGTRRYLEEAMRDVFTHVPSLAGFVNIAHGERDTTCLSGLHPTGALEYMPWVTDPCPRCHAGKAAQIHLEVCEALIRGMRAGNPRAELFSWYYHPQPAPWRAAWVKEVARRLPEGTTFIYNFESGACEKQAGRLREGGDYWLANVGPAEPFREIAAAVREGGGHLAAKLQTGCGFEMATVPYVPVPGLLWRKYRAMREMGVDSVMQCWLVGSYPGVQNAAAGELAFEDFSDGEEEFLVRLAAPAWGDQAKVVAKVWQAFARAYSFYPLSNNMQYYGPFNEGVAWPLCPDVEMKPIWPSWKPHFPVSGDAIGDALDYHTLEESLMLMGRMCDLPDLRQLHAETSEQKREIGLLRAVQLHFESGRNIYEFYWQRRRALIASRVNGDTASAVAAIDRMKDLVKAEMAVAAEMRGLSSADPRLGFHPEAERYKYFPEMFDWRLERLQVAERRLDEIRGVCAQGRPYPESAFERSASVCRVNGPAVAADGFSWRVTGDERRLTVRGMCSPNVAKDRVYVAFMDAAGTTYADFYDIRRNGIAPLSAFRTPDETRATCRIDTSQDGGWSFELTLDAWKWGRDQALRPAWIYVSRPASRYVWPDPPKDGWPRCERLNQDVSGDEFGRLAW